MVLIGWSGPVCGNQLAADDGVSGTQHGTGGSCSAKSSFMSSWSVLQSERVIENIVIFMQKELCK